MHTGGRFAHKFLETVLFGLIEELTFWQKFIFNLDRRPHLACKRANLLLIQRSLMDFIYNVSLYVIMSAKCEMRHWIYRNNIFYGLFYSIYLMHGLFSGLVLYSNTSILTNWKRVIFSFFSHAQAVLDCENVPKSNHLIVCTYLPRFISATQNAN